MPRACFERLEERRLLSSESFQPGTYVFQDLDGDKVTVSIDDASLRIVTNDDTGKWEEIEVNGGSSLTTHLNISVKKANGGDGRLEVDTINGEEIFSLKAPNVAITGIGVGFRKARHIWIGSLKNDAVVQTFEPNKGSATTFRASVMNTTGQSFIADDMKLVKVGRWLDGTLNVGGGLLNLRVTGEYKGEINVDRGLFLPGFRRRFFLTRKIQIDGPASGTLRFTRTFVLKLYLKQGTVEPDDGGNGFFYLTNSFSARKVIINGDLLGRFSIEKSLNKFLVTGNVDADVDMINVGKINIRGNVDNTFNYRDADKIAIDGSVDGSLVGRFAKKVIIGGDVTGNLRFVRNSPGNRIGVRTLKVMGKMDGGKIVSSAGMGNIYIAGGMFNSQIAAGAHPNRVPKDRFPADLDELKTNDDFRSSNINSVRIGYNRSGESFFTQSYILAWDIRNVKLGYAQAEDVSSEAFGVGAFTVGRVDYVSSNFTYHRSGLRAFRITDGKFMVARLTGTYPVGP